MRRSLFRVLALLFVGTVILGQLQRIQLSGTIAVYPHEFILLGLFVLSTVGHLHELKLWIHKEKSLLQPCIAFLGCIVVGLLLHTIIGKNSTVGWLYLLRLLLYGSVWPICDIASTKQWIKKRDLKIGLLIVSYGVALLGLLQYAAFPDTRGLLLLGWDDHYYRAISTLLDPPFTAHLELIGLLLTLSWIRQRSRMSILWILGYISFLLTYSRAAFLSMLIAIMWISWKSKQIRFGISFGTILLCSILLLPRFPSEGTKLERTASVFARARTYEQNLGVQHWSELLIGQGWYLAHTEREPGSRSLFSHTSAPDNPFVHIFQSLGIPGIISAVWLAIALFQRWRADATMSAIWISLLVGSFFNNLLFYPWILASLMVLVASSSRREVALKE